MFTNKCLIIVLFIITLYLPAGEKPYNVLFIAVDDLNDWVGCYGGHPDAKTPNIDRLAAGGVKFTNAQCPSPACKPSRSALMTGLFPWNTGIYGNYEDEYLKYQDLKNTLIIPQYFAQNGYHTMGVGKLLHSGTKPEHWNETGKYRYFVNPVPSKTVKGEPRSVEDFINISLPLSVDTSEMTDWKMADWAAKKLKEKHDKPFFLACGLYRPHYPRHAPLKHYKKFPLDQITLPKVTLDDLKDINARAGKTARTIIESEAIYRKVVQAYLANISFADDCVGHLLNALETSEYKDNTVVILWSDHGMHVGEKYHFSKFTLWEESARVVLICKGPGILKGVESTVPVNLVDMYPTLIDWCKLPVKKDLDGESFYPQLLNPKALRAKPSITAGYNGFTVRTDRWRYIAYNNGNEELYDHSGDENEWTNLAGKAEYENIKNKLKTFLPVNPAKPRSGKKK